jgi:hypothetical protein
MDAELASALKILNKKARVGRCMYSDAHDQRCRNPAIASHSVQKSVTLSSIAEAGHVYQIFLDSFQRDDEVAVNFRKIGRSKASVFPGFCKRHDNDLFGPIENNDVNIGLREACLLVYRVVCMELFKKEHNIKLYSNSVIRELGAKYGRPDVFDGFLQGTVLGKRDLLIAKRNLEIAIHSQDFSRLVACYFTLDEPLPFCMASPLAPEYDLNGEELLPAHDSIWHPVGAFVGRLGSANIALVGGMLPESGDHILRFVSTFSNLPLESIGDVSLNLSLEYAENTFFRISWIDALNEQDREGLIRKFMAGTPGVLGRGTQTLRHSLGHVQVGARNVQRLQLG